MNDRIIIIIRGKCQDDKVFIISEKRVTETRSISENILRNDLTERIRECLNPDSIKIEFKIITGSTRGRITSVLFMTFVTGTPEIISIVIRRIRIGSEVKPIYEPGNIVRINTRKIVKIILDPAGI